MKWLPPPTIKIYEALGAVADGRVDLDGNSTKVYSSTGNKFYEVTYDPDKKAIMANDNGSYWKGYLGYPSIAFLMKAGVITYDEKIGSLLKGIAWKDINQMFKNDFTQTLDFILSEKTSKERGLLADLVSRVERELISLDLGILGQKKAPPEGY